LGKKARRKLSQSVEELGYKGEMCVFRMYKADLLLKLKLKLLIRSCAGTKVAC